MNVLLDTNVIIPLEDTGQELKEEFANIRRLSQELGFNLLIHPLQADDIKRDKDLARRKILLSRLSQYSMLQSPPEPQPEFLEEYKWGQKDDNDRIDNALLFSLNRNACHLFVTNDKGIHRKAGRTGLGERVHYSQQFLVFLQTRSGEDTPPPMGIDEDFLYNIDIINPFFDSLREGYSGFDDWYAKSSRDQRKAWVIKDENSIYALCIYKIENNETVTLGGRVLDGQALKLCTLKVGRQWRGRKMGERFLYTAFTHAMKSDCDWVYLHAYGGEHALLVELCEQFGFEKIGIDHNERDEVYCKSMKEVDPSDSINSLEYAVKYYPNFKEAESIRKFLVPIQPQYHDELFPDASDITLFHGLPEFYPPQSNTIKKAYICHAPTKQIRPGDLLLFYRTRDRFSVECIGIVERAFHSQSLENVLPEVSKRTVYGKARLREWLEKNTLVITFRLQKYFSPIKYAELCDAGVKMPIQSIRKVEESIYQKLRKRIHV